MNYHTYLRLEMFELNWEVSLVLSISDESLDHELQNISCNFAEVFRKIDDVFFLSKEQKEELENEIEKQVNSTDWKHEIECERIDKLI